MSSEQSTLWSEEHLANPSLSLDSEKEWMTRVATWPSSFLALLTQYAPVGWSGRTCPASCQAAKDGTLVPSSEGWGNSGMGGPTESLTLNTSAWTATSVPYLNDDDVCSLSDILETGDVPQRYYLSKRACQGILRRAERRGKELPPALQSALLSVAQGTTA